MKSHLCLAFLVLLSSCQTSTDEAEQKEQSTSFYVGTYTDKASEGIYKYALSEDGTLEFVGLVAKSQNPSFLARTKDQRYLVAVNEINQEGVGSIESYLVRGDSLKFINRSSSGGAHPCFVSINEQGYVLCANYTGGNVGLLKLNDTGNLSELLDIQTHSGKGSTDRQEAPHAHSAWFDKGSNQVIAVDLGTNELWFSTLDEEQQQLIPSNPNTLKMEPGAGPRHLSYHPNGKWIYVLNELNATITIVEKQSDSTYLKGPSISILPEGFNEANTSADIHTTSDGKFVYASNRGHNSIAICKVNEKDGTLSLVGHESTKGDGPRNFSLSPNENFLLVANQNTDNIVAFKRDSDTGLLSFVSQVEAPTPVCILF